VKKITLALFFLSTLSGCFLSIKTSQLNQSEVVSANGLSMSNPPSASGNIKQPILKLNFDKIMTRISISTDAACTQVLAEATPQSTSVEIELPSLADGSYAFYAQVTSQDGKTSCLESPALYLLDTQGPDLLNVKLSNGSDTFDLDQTPIISWNAAVDAGVGLDHYEVCLGTQPGTCEIENWKNIGLASTYQFKNLSHPSLQRGTMIYASLKAVDTLGNAQIAPGDGYSLNSLFPSFNGPVNTIAKLGRTLYATGTFNGVGKYIGSGVFIDPSSGQIINPNPAAASAKIIGGKVNSVVGDGSGGFFIGGEFTSPIS